MRAEFDATIEDFVYAQILSLRRTNAARRWRWQSIASAGLLTGVFCYLIIPDERTVKLVASVGGAALGAALQHFSYDRKLRKRIRKICLEKYGENPGVFEVELMDSGMWTKWSSEQITFDWANLEVIDDTPRSIDFWMHNGNGFVVQKRAFADTDHYRQFLRRARELHESNRGVVGVL